MINHDVLSSMVKYLLVHLLLLSLIVEGFGQSIQHTYKLSESLLLERDKASYSQHGYSYEDPYRLLEDVEDSVNQRWYHNENKLARNVLNSIQKQPLLNALTVTGSEVDVSMPKNCHKGFFYILSDKRLMYKSSINSQPQEIFNTADIEPSSKNHIVTHFQPSPSGRYVALAIASAGNELASMHVLDTKRGSLLDEKIPRCMLSNVAWVRNEQGFLYNQLYEHEEGSHLATFEDSQLKFHLIGEEPNQDRIVFSRKQCPELNIDPIDFPFATIHPKSDQLIVYTYRGDMSGYVSLFRTKLANLYRSEEIAWQQIVNFTDTVADFAVDDHNLFLLSYKEAPNGKVIKIRNEEDLTDSSEVLVTESKELLDDIFISPKALYIIGRTGSSSQVNKLFLENYVSHRLQLPFSGSVQFPYSRFSESDTIVFKMESWNVPETVVTDFSDSNTAIAVDLPRSTYLGIDQIVFRELEVISHDGTEVPLTLVYNSNMLKKQKLLPVILEAYGAYGYTISPSIHNQLYQWARDYGIVAIAHVRGGGVNGESWHKDGTKSSKPNSWKDMIACAEHLIKEEYTKADMLIAYGASAGGLVAGRAIVERPELFKAALLRVPLTNPLRHEKMSNTTLAPEFGTVEKEEEFLSLLKMDPYMNLKPGIRYPATMFLAGSDDVRIPLWQPGKMVALMQAYLQDEVPILFRINYEGGHFGSDLEENKSEIADMLAFCLWQVSHPDFQPDVRNSTTVQSDE